MILQPRNRFNQIIAIRLRESHSPASGALPTNSIRAVLYPKLAPAAQLLFALLVFASAEILTAAERPAADSDVVDSVSQELLSSWSTLKGRFVYPGDVPVQELRVAKGAKAGWAKNANPKEAFLVHPKNKGLANVVVWLYVKSASTELPAEHESYQKVLADKLPVQLVFDGGRIQPHIATVRTNQKLEIISNDRVAHSPLVQSLKNPPIGPLFLAKAGGRQLMSRSFKHAEIIPIRCDCAIHPWERACVLVQKHPYMAVSDENGEFVIEHIPRGDWTFRFWHEKLGYIKEVQRDGTTEEWVRGRRQIVLEEECVDLGAIKILQSAFKDKQ